MLELIFMLLIENKYPDYTLTITTFLLGFCCFNIIPITFGEFMSRTSPYYLLTVSVLITMSSQFVGTVMVWSVGILLKNKIKNLGISIFLNFFLGKYYFYGNCGIFLLLFFLNFFTSHLSIKDARRASVVTRLEIDKASRGDNSEYLKFNKKSKEEKDKKVKKKKRGM